MLFSGDTAKKSVTVLSGGERARAVFAKMMIEEIGRVVAAAKQRDAAAMKSACVAHVKSAMDAVIQQISGNGNNEKDAQRPG